MKKLLLFFLCFPILLSFGADATSDKLAKLRTSYESQLKDASTVCKASIAKLNLSYAEQVGKLKAEVQKAGDTDALIAVKFEVDRFSVAEDVTESIFSTNVVKLAALQKSYVSIKQGHVAKKAQRVYALTSVFERDLESIQKEFTRNDKLEDALKVKEERAKIWDSWEAMDAKKVVDSLKAAQADSQAKKPDAKPVDKSAQPTKPKLTVPVSKSKVQSEVRKRYEDFCELVLAQDFDKAAEYIDPEFVEEFGTKNIKERLGFIFPFLRMTDNPRVKLAVDKVELDDDMATATVTPKVWVANEWNTLGPCNWKKVDDKWYLIMDKSAQFKDKSDKAIFRKANKAGRRDR